jgi:hypothetical protein
MFTERCYEPDAETTAKQPFLAPIPYDKCQMCKDFKRFSRRTGVGRTVDRFFRGLKETNIPCEAERLLLITGSLREQLGFLRLEFRVVNGSRVLRLLQINQLLADRRHLWLCRRATTNAEAKAAGEKGHCHKANHPGCD